MNAAMSDNLKESPGQMVGRYGRAMQFLAEVKVELSRVTWPTRREVWATTVVVILTSMLFGVYLWVIDLGLSQVMDWVFRKLGTA
jgi:preprotein translocase subunit SecE